MPLRSTIETSSQCGKYPAIVIIDISSLVVFKHHTLARAFFRACRDSFQTLSPRVQLLCERYLRPLMRLNLGNTLTCEFICLFQKSYIL